jgi:DNA-binding protein H-NS
MTILRKLRAELGRVNELAHDAKRRETAQALARFKADVELLGITESEIRLALGYDKVKQKPAVKYYDPFSGQKWSGFGRVPKWLAGKNLADYLVERAPVAKPWWPEEAKRSTRARAGKRASI